MLSMNAELQKSGVLDHASTAVAAIKSSLRRSRMLHVLLLF